MSIFFLIHTLNCPKKFILIAYNHGLDKTQQNEAGSVYCIQFTSLNFVFVGRTNKYEEKNGAIQK